MLLDIGSDSAIHTFLWPQAVDKSWDLHVYHRKKTEL
jgi:hypothetical protein